MGTAAQVMTQGRDQFDKRPQVVAQRSLVGDPGFGVGKRLEDAPAMASGPSHNALVDQKKENGGCVTERHARPVVRPAEIVFQVQSDVPRGLVEECCDVLVIAMSAVVGKPPRPGCTKFPSKWFNHGISSPQGSIRGRAL